MSEPKPLDPAPWALRGRADRYPDTTANRGVAYLLDWAPREDFETDQAKYPGATRPDTVADCDCIEVVDSWLYNDSRGFRIPGSAWGIDLKQSLEHVLELARMSSTPREED